MRILVAVAAMVVLGALSTGAALQPPHDHDVPWVIVGTGADTSMRVNNVTVRHDDVILRRGEEAGIHARRGGQDVVVPWPDVLAIDASPDDPGEMYLVLATGEVLVIPEGSIAFEGVVAPDTLTHSGFINARVGEDSTYTRLVFPSHWSEDEDD